MSKPLLEPELEARKRYQGAADQSLQTHVAPVAPYIRPGRRRTGIRWTIVVVVSPVLIWLMIALLSFRTIGTNSTAQTGQPTSSNANTSNAASTDGMSGMANAGSSSSAKQIVPPAHQTYNAQAPAALQGNTVNVTLTVTEQLVSIAPGIAYHAWTFNGTVPGPVIRVRQGQTIHFTLANHGSMPHSIDFHAAQTPWNVNYQDIPAGKSFSFDWQANYPGVFMYHCGAPTVIYHMANGMYGAIIVDPANGWTPAQEYVMVQSEFYTQQQADGSYSADPNKLTSGMPDYVVFNGYTNQYKTSPLTA